jgi:hypothetical protein
VPLAQLPTHRGQNQAKRGAKIGEVQPNEN